MRSVRAAMLLAAAMTACARAPILDPSSPVAISIQPYASAASPSPLVEVRVGRVRAVVPESWHAEMLPQGHVPQEGFIASPKIDEWVDGTEGVSGVEAFWVDVNQLAIPSDYYYLAARDASFRQIASGEPCRPVREQVFVNHPPDLTGATFSPSDYVAGANGTCIRGGRPTRWAYMIAAPGYGPARAVGIPSSGLYVVLAEVSGPKSGQLLKQMIASARFGGSTLSQIAAAAGHLAAA